MRTYKLLILFVISSMVLISNLNSQDITEIKIKFKEKEFEEGFQQAIDTLEEGDYYKIIIENINLNLWDVHLNTKDTVFAKPLKTPTFADFNLEAINALTGSLNFVTTSAVDEMLNKKAIILDTSVYVDVNKAIADTINQEKITLDNLTSELSNYVGEVDTLIYNVNKKLLSAYEEGNTIPSTFSLDKALGKIEQLRNWLSDFNRSIISHKNSYLKFSKTYAQQIYQDKKFNDEDKKRKDRYDGFISTISKIKETINAERSIELLRKLVFIQNKDSSFTSMPIQFKGDQAQVNLKFVPKKVEYNLQTYEMSFAFPLKRKNYWSVGVSFYGSNMVNEYFSSISVPETDSTKIYQLVKEDDQMMEIGLATLLRFGCKIDEDYKIGIHGTLGPGISISEKIRPRILFGGGFSFGKKHSISVDFGGILGYVNIKSNAYDLNRNYDIKPENITVSNLQLGGFVAIGYLFRL